MADVSKMKWDLKNTPEKKLLDTYKDLAILYNEVFLMMERPREPHPKLSIEQIISLVIYTYHLNSPLVQSEASIHKRRFEALKLLGIQFKGEAEKSPYFPYIVGNNPFLIRLALQFCKMEDNFKWFELCRKQEMLDDTFLTLKSEMGGTEKKSANEMLKIKLEVEAKTEPLQQRIQQLATEIFRNDIQLLNSAASQIILEKRRRLLTPEDIAFIPKDELQEAFAE